MQLKSEIVKINNTPENLKNFLTDANNLFEILPQDKISDWKADATNCSFKVQGGIVISLIQDGSEGNDKVFLKSGEKSPFPFKLTITLSEIDGQTEGFIQFDGEVNMFLKMMVEKPLTNLFNYMSNKLKEKFA
jgi:hypothetical protein